MKLDLYDEEVFCLTPNGDVITLPNGATPVDFAFAVHTQVGEKLIGAKINNKLVSLGSSLKTGDTVEILTTKDAYIIFILFDRNRTREDDSRKMYKLSGVPKTEFWINLGSKMNKLDANNEILFLKNLLHNK